MRKLLALLLLLIPTLCFAQGSTNTAPACYSPALEVTQGDDLTLNVTYIPGLPTALPPANWYMTYRMKLTDGTIKDFQQNIVVSSPTTSGTAYNYPLPPGCLLAVTLGNSGTAPRGLALAQVFFGKSIWPVSPNYNAACIIATTMAAFQTVTWPYHTPQQAEDGPGYNVSYTVSNPATATNWTKTFNGANRVHIVNIRFTLTTSATAGTRQVCINFTDANANIYASKCVQGTQAASLIVTYNFAVAVGSDIPTAATLIAIPSTNVAGTANDIMTALPFGLKFQDASVVASNVIGLTTGDQLSAIVIRGEVWNTSD